MKWSHLLIVPTVLALVAPIASGGIFSRKPQPNPAERVPELLKQLQTSTNEDQRSAAAEELRQYDPKSYPEIVSTLIAVLGRDPSTSVRAEAASSLGKIRPISQQAGFALEQAQSNDSSMRVRLATRQALLQYHFNGYRSGKADAPANPGTSPSGNSTSLFRPPLPNGLHPSGLRESTEPPLATPIAVPPSAAPVLRQTAAPVFRPIPANAPRLLPAPRVVNSAIASPNPSPTPIAGPILPPPE